MEIKLDLEILPQPTETTCGPTCLHAVYRYYSEDISLAEVISQVPPLADGGTLAVMLGCHALARGYQARIHTNNLQVFDPTWFQQKPFPLRERLLAQMAAKTSEKLRFASQAYVNFLDQGGEILMDDLTPSLLRRYLTRSFPILTGLSSTYLYRCAREYGPQCEPDDVRGYPVGHFVVLCGYDSISKNVLVADPYLKNPLGPEHYYEIDVDHVIRSILLGVLTYDANVLIVEPRRKKSTESVNDTPGGTVPT